MRPARLASQESVYLTTTCDLTNRLCAFWGLQLGPRAPPRPSRFTLSRDLSRVNNGRVEVF